MKLKIFLALIIIWASTSFFAPTSSALLSPHPVQLYEKGITQLNNYRGEKSTLHEANETFTELIEKFPDSAFGYLGLSRIHLIDAYSYGTHYNMKIIRNQALPFALKALELGPSLRDVHDHYSVIENVFDQYYNNQEQAQDYLSLFPESPETFNILGNFIRDHGEYARSLEYYKMALDLNPPDSLRYKILNQMASIYLNVYQQPEKAIGYYREIQNDGITSPVISKYLGISYLKMRKYEQAIQEFQTSFNALKTDNIKYLLIQAKGYLSAEEDKLQKAVELLEQASNYEDDNSALHYHLGNLYYRLENYESAYDHFRKVIELTPKQSEAYYFAGRAAQLLGQKTVAYGHYEQYLELDANTQMADWIRENISEFKPEIVAADNSSAVIPRDHESK